MNSYERIAKPLQLAAIVVGLLTVASTGSVSAQQPAPTAPAATTAKSAIACLQQNAAKVSPECAKALATVAGKSDE